MSSVHWSGSCKVTLSKQKKCYFSSCMNRPQTLFSLVACFYFAFHLSSILGLFNRQPLGWYPPVLSRILQNLLSKTQFTFRSVLKGKGVLWQPAAPLHHSSNSIRDPTARCNSILHSVGQFKGAYRERTTWHQEISSFPCCLCFVSSFMARTASQLHFHSPPHWATSHQPGHRA